MILEIIETTPSYFIESNRIFKVIRTVDGDLSNEQLKSISDIGYTLIETINNVKFYYIESEYIDNSTFIEPLKVCIQQYLRELNLNELIDK